MLFSDFINVLPKVLKEQLPAFAAHIKMAPEGRKITLEPGYYLKYNPRKSAVLMLVYEKERRACLVLIKRNAYKGVHSAQISFPGGKMELTDKDLSYTALREANEEIGVRQEDVHLAMPFTEIYIPPSNFLVAPYLGILQGEPDFVADVREVSEIIELPLSMLLDDAILISAPIYTESGISVNVPAFLVNGHVVWGATAMILSELKETIKTAIK
ncbi:NUDIX hydrolase [Flavobacterium sp. RHBU_24]|uniref:NUDIX hydrolase n=1 Tax=Flavobacterium sp. RHBU_24 TaxID=3391185 RepID=UPI00398489AC